MDKRAAWAENYERRRAGGEVGWGSALQYTAKIARLELAIRRCSVPDGARWLDIGCGAGNVAEWLADHGFAVEGIDVVPEAIAWARDRCHKARFHVGDVQQMTMFRDGLFDVVYEGDCLQMLLGEERQRALAEVRRVLRPKGLFLCGVNVARFGLKRAIGHARTPVSYDPVQRVVTVAGRAEYHLADAESFRRELAAAGFIILHETKDAPRGNREYMDSWLELDTTANGPDKCVPLPDSVTGRTGES